mgnify:CR=1 FL=1
MSSEYLFPIILSGGFGSRLWPLSRKSFPKQFLSLDTNSKKSLLQKTQERISTIENICNPIIICNEEHRFIVAEQMREINIKPNSILLEPFGRNTAPAIALGALKSLEFNKDPYLLVLSSDHEIKNENSFFIVIEKGIEYASKNRLVTFGVIPNSPETGYGYIQSADELDSKNIQGSNIECFIEKPNINKAKELIKDKRFTWNSGMFLFKAKAILGEIEKYHPEIITYCKESLRSKLLDLDFQRLDIKSFSKCPNISIDISVMEKTSMGTVLPLDAGWSDIGSWNSVWQINNKDQEGNAIEGNVIIKNTSNCYIRGEKRLVAAIGLKNLIIVETGDAILIVEKDQSQEVKNIVNTLKENGIPEGQEHKKIYRPWGYFESVVDDSRWKVKLINVKPGENLSLQMHNHRSEHWVVVSGTAKVEIDSSIKIIQENQSAYIPLGAKHRLSNPGKINLVLIEVQSGSYLGEDDIERFEDSYGRIKLNQ